MTGYALREAIEGKIMREQTRIRVFVSYSRKDTSFADRLDVSLKSRGFDTWVDQRKLEGGQDFTDAIQVAIERSQVLVVILSPDSIASRYVKNEYRYALNTLGMVVIPLLYRPVDRVPFDLNGIEWVDFQGTYDDALRNLVNTLARLAPPIMPMPLPDTSHQSASGETPLASVSASDSPANEPELVVPQPLPSSPALSLKELYDRGDAANARGELEQAAIFFQQIVDERPDYLNGKVSKDLKQLRQKLQDMRIDDLRADALRARQNGEWRREITDWQAILVLDSRNSDAKDALGVAEHNQKYEDMYAIVGDRVKRHELDLARQKLRELWAEAPYYGDPENLAPQLRVSVPQSYEAMVAAQKIQEAATEKQEARAAYSKGNFGTKYPVLLLPFMLLALSVVGVLAGLVATSHPIALGFVSAGGLDRRIESIIVIAIAIALFSVLGYVLGYRRVTGPLGMAATALCAIALATATTLFLANVFPSSPAIRAYDFPFLGTLRLSTNTPWAFGGLFAAAYAVVGVVVVGAVGFIVGIITDEFSEYFFPSLGAGLFLGVGIGAVIGLTVGFFSWEVSGIIWGALLGLFVLALGILSIAQKGAKTERAWFSLFSFAGASIVLALVNWLLCWFPFHIDSSGTLVWAIWATMPLLGLLGVMFTIAVWVQRPSRA